MSQLKKANLLSLLLSFMIVTTYAKSTPTLSTLPNPGLNLINKARLVKPMEATTQLSFALWLKLRNKKTLTQLAREVYDPNSPLYHQFLTSDLYEQKFAPSKKAADKVRQFFAEQGMQAQIVNNQVRVTGKVEQIEHLLHVHMNYYLYRKDRVYANSNAPQLPRDMAQYVSEITGLSTFPLFHSNSRSLRKQKSAEPHSLDFIWNNFIPKAIPTDISLQGFTGNNLQKAYNLSNIPTIQGESLNGSGQTLVIVDKCGTNGPAQILSDANQYFKENGITPFVISGPARNFAIANADGSPFTHCQNASSFSREIVLDVEASHTIATGANTALILGEDQRTTLMTAIDTLLHNHFTIAGFENAYVISNSWSGSETSDPHLESKLALAASAGISVNFSSGDCGDNTYTTAVKCNSSTSSPTVNYPSSSPFVTAVGATALFVDTNYRYAFETVWGTVDTIHSSYGGGTGGGISQVYGPVAWQNSISNFTAGGYGVISNYGNHRALPDIAMLGDPQTGLLIIADGVQVKDGGTSLACPLFSATLVIVNQARSLLNKGTPIGQAAPYLYIKNNELLSNRALNLIIPPALILNGATPPPAITIANTPAPASSFTINNITFGWDSSLTVEPEDQYWNDAVGVGSPNLPNFIMTMANM